MTLMDRTCERDLVARLRTGDPAAFDEVHGAYNLRLFNFLARLAQRRDVAEDLLEETWLRLVTHAASLRPDTQLAPWLFTVARNLFGSHCRSRLVETSHAASLIGLWPPPAAEASPFELLSASETERHLETALASLPLAYREALLLVTSDELTAMEAAAVCGISPEALRQRVSRARAMLARKLESADIPAAAQLREAKT